MIYAQLDADIMVMVSNAHTLMRICANTSKSWSLLFYRTAYANANCNDPFGAYSKPK